jgi:hypothetical protein
VLAPPSSSLVSSSSLLVLSCIALSLQAAVAVSLVPSVLVWFYSSCEEPLSRGTY